MIREENQVDLIKELVISRGAADVALCSFERVKDRLIPCAAVKRLPKNAKTVICALFPYKVRHAAPENICRYAAVPDYHTVCGGFLENAATALSKMFPENTFSCFTDNSPIPEVYAAAAAGLGVIGKNGLLINKKYGSFVFIGEIVTDLSLDTNDMTPQGCLNCGRCEAACPVGLDKGKCLSKITQKKQELSAPEANLIKSGGCVWGCDICANACPMNADSALTEIAKFINGYRHHYILGEEIENRAYAWRGLSVIARNAKLLESEKGE